MEKHDHNNEYRLNSKQTCIKIDFTILPANSCLRRKFSNCHPNNKDLYDNHIAYYCMPIL